MLYSAFPCQTFAAETSATSAILVDADSGRVLYEQNAGQKMLIASTTKILTALVAIRHGDLNASVKVSREAAYTEGSSAAVWAAALLRERCGGSYCTARWRNGVRLCEADE